MKSSDTPERCFFKAADIALVLSILYIIGITGWIASGQYAPVEHAYWSRQNGRN